MKITTTLMMIYLLTSHVWGQGRTLSSAQKADRLYLALAGASPTNAEKAAAVSLINQGRFNELADNIINDPGSRFYNVVVLGIFNKVFDRELSSLAEASDSALNAVGFTRDGQFSKLLYSDSLYQFEGPLITLDSPTGLPADVENSIREFRPTNDRVLVTFQRQGQTVYAPIPLYNYTKNDREKVAIETYDIPLINSNIFKVGSQATYTIKDVNGIAGVASTRGFAKMAYDAGTNRRAVALTMNNLLCKDMEVLHDTTIPDFRVRRDVDRQPGGDESVFQNRCQGCHAGMDALAGAFAYYDYNDGGMSYTYGQVVEKYNRNNLFSDGHITQSDSWLNMWVIGQNASLEWNGGVYNGNGAKSFMEMISKTGQFRKCMAQRVFEKVCFRKPTNDLEYDLINSEAKAFEVHDDLKVVFKNLSIACLGD